MSNLTTLPKGDSAWLLRKSIQRIMQQVSVLETNIGSSTTGNSSDTQIIFNDAGTLRGDSGLTYNKTTDLLSVGAATITGDLTVDTSTLKVDSATNNVSIGGLVNKVTGVSGSGTGLTIQASAGPTLGLWDTTDPSYFTNLAQVDANCYLYNNAAGALLFGVGNVEAMRLNSTGLGVGGSPINKLTVTVAPGTTTSDGLRVTDSSRSIGVYQTGATYSYLGIGGNQNLIYTAGGRLDIVADSQSLFLRTGTNNYLNLDTSGNVGIGVTPQFWGSNWKAIDLAGGGRVYTVSGTGTHGFSFNAFNNNTNWLYQFSTVASRFELQQSGNFAWFTAPSGTAGTAITFTQAMTLDASGNLLVGTTTNTNSSRVFARGTGGATTLAIQSSTGDTANPGLIVGKFDNDSTTSQILVRFTINNNAAGSGQINANGASQAAFGTFSDSRLKENIVSLPSQLANILSLRPVEFDYKDGSGHQIGFVAQEMQEVYSDSVGEQNGFLTVTGWSKTEARLVSAIKELAAKVQALEAKLA